MDVLQGIKHRKNEIFLDVIEKLNLLVSSNGTVLHSEIIGVIQMKSFLSGMPELKLGLNDKLMFEATGRSATRIKAVEVTDSTLVCFAIFFLNWGFLLILKSHL
jgi:AP-1 complex subunit mu